MGNAHSWTTGTTSQAVATFHVTVVQVSAGSAIVSDRDHLYIDHQICPDDTQTDCTVYMVVLDLASGDELARVKVAGTKPSLAKIIVGEDCVYYVASEAGEEQGFVTKVSSR